MRKSLRPDDLIAFVYKNVRVVIEAYPKDDGEYAWAFSIGGADFRGPEKVRSKGRLEALKDARNAAERVIDGVEPVPHPLPIARTPSGTDQGSPCGPWCQTIGTDGRWFTLWTKSQ